tara:strand:- start:1146 stop:1298 length:153 start_codon:yes stop_codon:yes gene_type:complete
MVDPVIAAAAPAAVVDVPMDDADSTYARGPGERAREKHQNSVFVFALSSL